MRRGWAGVTAVAIALTVPLTVAACRTDRSAAGRPVPSSTASSTASGTPSSTASGTASGTASPAEDCGPWDCDQKHRLDAAAALVATAPGKLGVVVRDRRTGAVWRSGTADHVMWTSSTIKLAIATSLLERARTGEVALDGTARAQIAAMLHVSDDKAADALWKRYGRDALVPRFQQVYGMTGLTFVPGFPRYWGFMKSSAEDLHRLMSYVLEQVDPADRDYLIAAMRGVGDIQKWGVWAAGPQWQPGTKDGWSIESDPGGKHWCTSTVGFAGPDARYVIAVMDDVPVGKSIGTGVHAVSDVVATVFGAPVPANVTVPDASTGL